MQWRRTVPLSAAFVGSLALAAVALLPAVPADAIEIRGECPGVDAQMLSNQCDLCAANRVCYTKNTSCMCTLVDSTTFTLLIPFTTGTAVSSSKKSLSDYVEGGDDTARTPWVSNDDVIKIDQLLLLSTTTAVKIRGGNSLSAISKGTVADIRFHKGLLASGTQATQQLSQVFFANLDLKIFASLMVRTLPNSVDTVAFDNVRLQDVPVAIFDMKSLKRLYLRFNYITEVSTSFSTVEELYLWSNWIATFTAACPNCVTVVLAYNKLTSVPPILSEYPKLTNLSLQGNDITYFVQVNAVRSAKILDLSNNQISKFTVTDQPNLEHLDLSNNTLTAFPTAIFSHKSLKKLFVQLNARLANVSFTREQASFLSNLDEFQISTASLRSGCDASKQFVLKNYTVCVDGGTATGNGTSSPSMNDTPSSGVHVHSVSIPVIVIVSTLGVVVILLAVVLWKRRSSKSQAEKIEVEETIAATPSTLSGFVKEAGGTAGAAFDTEGTGDSANAASLWTDEELLALKVSVDDIEDVKKIGGGAFAEVWLVNFRRTTLMASKRLRTGAARRQDVQRFIQEIKLVSTLKHPNIVELTGVAWIRESDLQALFEYMDAGDLRSYLTNPDVSTQWNTDKLQIAVDVAEALVYLHSFMPPLVHRDLKSRNVLLTSKLQAKLTDFGVSRYRSGTNTMTAGIGTGRWLAPEVITGDGSYGGSADIFSFGVVLSELDSHQIPYADVRGANGNQLADVALFKMISSGGLKPSMSRECPAEVADLANRCLALVPEDRPSAVEIAYVLRTFVKSQRSFYI